MSEWHGLSRPRRAASRPGEGPGAGIRAWALYRTRSRIELPRPDLSAGSVGVGFLLSGFLRRFRLCPLAGLSFGHVDCAFPNLLCGTLMILFAKASSLSIEYPATQSV
jgi:hypothetical protein